MRTGFLVAPGPRVSNATKSLEVEAWLRVSLRSGESERAVVVGVVVRTDVDAMAARRRPDQHEQSAAPGLFYVCQFFSSGVPFLSHDGRLLDFDLVRWERCWPSPSG